MSNTERLFPIGILEKSKSKELIPNFEKGELYLADYLNKKFIQLKVFGLMVELNNLRTLLKRSVLYLNTNKSNI